MSIDIKGTITHIGETKSFGEKGFTKRELAVQTDEKYPQELALEVTKDKCAQLDTMSVGDVVSASVNLKGRRWQGPNGLKFFVSLEVWKLEVTQKGAGQGTTPAGSSSEELPF